MEPQENYNQLKEYVKLENVTALKKPIQNAVEIAVKNDFTFLRNSVYKMISELSFRISFGKNLKALLEQKDFVEARVLLLVLLLQENRAFKDRLSKSMLQKFCSNDKWVNILLRAILISKELPEFASKLKEEIFHFSKKSSSNLMLFIKLTQRLEDKLLIVKAIKSFQINPTDDGIATIGFLNWLKKNDYNIELNNILAKLIANPKLNEANIIQLLLFLHDEQLSEFLIPFGHRILKKKSDYSDEICLLISANLIGTYIRMIKYEKKNIEEKKYSVNRIESSIICVEHLYNCYWRQLDRPFPYSLELIENCHLLQEGELIMKDICAKHKLLESDDPNLQAIKAKKLEYRNEFRAAFKIWSQLLENDPSNPSLLRFISLNIIVSHKSNSLAKKFGERLSAINGYSKLGKAVMALSENESPEKLLNGVFDEALDRALIFERDDKLFDELLKESISAVRNSSEKYEEMFEREGIINKDGYVDHPDISDRISLKNKYFIGKYIELERQVNNPKTDSSSLSDFVNNFKLLLRFDLSTSDLIALLRIFQHARKKHGFLLVNEFNEFSFLEVRRLSKLLLWRLAMRAELENENITRRDLQIENEISTMTLKSAEATFKLINRYK